MVNAPIQITLYDPETNEEKETYIRTFVPWKLLKKAVHLGDEVDLKNPKDKDIDQIAMLVVDTFGGQFTLEELNEGADMGEMIAVLTNIMNRAKGFKLNPTPPVS